MTCCLNGGSCLFDKQKEPLLVRANCDGVEVKWVRPSVSISIKLIRFYRLLK